MKHRTLCFVLALLTLASVFAFSVCAVDVFPGIDLPKEAKYDAKPTALEIFAFILMIIGTIVVIFCVAWIINVTIPKLFKKLFTNNKHKDDKLQK